MQSSTRNDLDAQACRHTTRATGRITRYRTRHGAAITHSRRMPLAPLPTGLAGREESEAYALPSAQDRFKRTGGLSPPLVQQHRRSSVPSQRRLASVVQQLIVRVWSILFASEARPVEWGREGSATEGYPAASLSAEAVRAFSDSWLSHAEPVGICWPDQEEETPHDAHASFGRRRGRSGPSTPCRRRCGAARDRQGRAAELVAGALDQPGAAARAWQEPPRGRGDERRGGARRRVR